MDIEEGRLTRTSIPQLIPAKPMKADQNIATLYCKTICHADCFLSSAAVEIERDPADSSSLKYLTPCISFVPSSSLGSCILVVVCVYSSSPCHLQGRKEGSFFILLWLCNSDLVDHVSGVWGNAEEGGREISSRLTCGFIEAWDSEWRGPIGVREDRCRRSLWSCIWRYILQPCRS